MGNGIPYPPRTLVRGEGMGEGATSLEGEPPAEPKNKALAPFRGRGYG
jgi:hypothetical protein